VLRKHGFIPIQVNVGILQKRLVSS
jgi:hypothetical protein